MSETGYRGEADVGTSTFTSAQRFFRGIGAYIGVMDVLTYKYMYMVVIANRAERPVSRDLK